MRPRIFLDPSGPSQATATPVSKNNYFVRARGLRPRKPRPCSYWSPGQLPADSQITIRFTAIKRGAHPLQKHGHVIRLKYVSSKEHACRARLDNAAHKVQDMLVGARAAAA